MYKVSSIGSIEEAAQQTFTMTFANRKFRSPEANIFLPSCYCIYLNAVTKDDAELEAALAKVADEELQKFDELQSANKALMAP
jgi:hypothetical protein